MYDEIILNIIFSPLLASYYKNTTQKQYFISPSIIVEYEADHDEVASVFSKLTNINILSLANSFAKYLLEKEWHKKIKNIDYIANVEIRPAKLLIMLDKIPSIIPRNTKHKIDCESITLLNLATIWKSCPLGTSGP
jgi:hypothetical protein